MNPHWHSGLIVALTLQVPPKSSDAPTPSHSPTEAPMASRWTGAVLWLVIVFRDFPSGSLRAHWPGEAGAYD